MGAIEIYALNNWRHSLSTLALGLRVLDLIW